MTALRITGTVLAFAAAAIGLFATQTALWALLFRPWADPLGFGLPFTLATFPLSGAVGLFGGLGASRHVHRSGCVARNPS